MIEAWAIRFALWFLLIINAYKLFIKFKISYRHIGIHHLKNKS